MVVDVHSHLYPRSYIESLRVRTRPPRVVGAAGEERLITFPEEGRRPEEAGRPLTPDFWDIEKKLEFMNAHGIDRTVISLGNPWLDPFREEPELAGVINEELGRLRDMTNGRLLGTGVLPASDVASAVAVIQNIASSRGLVGVVTGPKICGMLLDESALDPVWAVLSEGGIPVLLHPKGDAGVDVLEGYGAALPVALGFPFETTIAVTRLVLAGVLERFPSLTLIASHGGGVIPYLAGRLDMVWETNPQLHERLKLQPSTSLSKLFVDSLVYEARAIRTAADLVGTSRLLYGTDHPWAHRWRPAVEAALSGTELKLALGHSAERLFGLVRDGQRAD